MTDLHRQGKFFKALPWVLAAVVAVSSGLMSFLRYLSCSNTNFDLAFYTRIVWGLAFGDRFNTLIGAHDLGLHLSPVLYLFVPLAFFIPIAPMLLAAQSLVLGACVPVIHRIALRKTSSPMLAAAFAAAWLLFPAVGQIGSREFHPGTLALFPLLVAYDLIDRGRLLAAAAALAAATLCREDVALVAAAAAVLVFMQGGKGRFLGPLVMAAGVAYFCVYMLAIQPLYLPPHGSMDEHFPGMGHSLPQVLAAMASHPGATALRLLGAEKLLYLTGLLVPLACLSLLSPRWLIPAAAPLLINFLSEFPDAARVESHYATLIIPSLFMSAAGGAAWISGLVRKRCGGRPAALRAVVFTLVALVLLCSLVAHRFLGALPGSRLFDGGAYTWGPRNGTLCWYAKELRSEKELSVLAPYGALARLADRRRIYSIDFIHPKPDVAVLDISQRKWMKLEIARWQDPWELAYEKLAADPAYGLWKSNPPYEMFWKGKPGGKERLAALSPDRLPRESRIQDIEWKGQVKLEAVEAYLRIRTEAWSGEYEKGIVVIMVFYWSAAARLPDDLFVKIELSGGGKTHVRFFRPTLGARRTGTWKKGEIIRDDQIFVSPGGWPLRELSARVVLVDPDGKPWPAGAEPQKIVWPEWEADRDNGSRGH
jgi:uncharacterized membrane protein